MRKEDKKFLLFLLGMLAFVIIECYFYAERHKELDKVADQLEETTVYNKEESPTEETTETIVPIEPPITETPPITTEEEITQEETLPSLDIPLNDEYKTFVYEKCNYDDDMYCWIMSVMKCESRFDPYAVSEDGHDFGFMQLREFWHDDWEQWFNVQDAKSPYDNITIGIGLLTHFLEKYEDKTLALMCYNSGEPESKVLWAEGVYSTPYTVEVMAAYEEYLEELHNNKGE